MINVVIPCLNEEHYIGPMLASLVKQSYTRFTVTLVDGDSTDKTVEVAKRYKSELPHLTILSTSIHHVGHQRNLGAREGSAKHLLFLDADVILHPHFLAQLLHDVKNRDIANCWLIPLSENPIDKMLYNLYNIFFLEFGKYVWPVAGGSNMFTTRKLFDTIGGFDETIQTWEDVDFVKRAIGSGAEFAVLRKPRIYTSVRRFQMQGRISFMLENLKGLEYAIRTGKMPSHIHYPMSFEYSRLLKVKKKEQFQKKLKRYYATYAKKLKILVQETLPTTLDKQTQKQQKIVLKHLRRFIS